MKQLESEVQHGKMELRNHRTTIEIFKYDLKQMENVSDKNNNENTQTLRASVFGLYDSLQMHMSSQKAEN